MKTNVAILLLVLGFGHGSMAVAQPEGTFTVTGDMTTPRSQHTATLLTNGTVLIAGGQSGNGQAVGIAELYDPSKGTFTQTSQRTTPRYSHTATLLPNGQVLIAGGFNSRNDFSALTSSELYDPANGTFAPTGNMTAAHAPSNATLLTNGTVLIAGTVDAELYDPVTGTYTTVAGTPTPFCCLFARTATLLTDGTVLFAAPGFGFPAAGYQCDPSRGTFRRFSDPGGFSTGTRLLYS